MNKAFEKISEAELEVMRVLWDAGEPLTVTELRTALQSSMGWEATTIKTLISRLVTKGAVNQEKRSVYYYSPAVSESDYNDWATARLVTKLYKGKAKNLVSALVRSDGLTAEDIEELRAMLGGEID